MRKVFYPVILHKEDVGYSVTVPDIDGCYTQGETMDEAITMAQDAMGLMLEDYKVYPKATNPVDIKLEQGDFVVMVQFDEDAYKKQFKVIKKTLTIPAWLNDKAEESHINFSGVLQEALKEKLNVE